LAQATRPKQHTNCNTYPIPNYNKLCTEGSNSSDNKTAVDTDKVIGRRPVSSTDPADIMDDFVAAAKVYSQDKNWTDLKKYMMDSVPLLEKNASKLNTALASLDPEQHSLAFARLMRIKILLPFSGDFDVLLAQFDQLTQLGNNEQIQQDLDSLVEVSHFMTNHLIEQQQAIRGITSIINAVRKCQRHPTDLTPIHTDLVQLCLSAKCFRPALPFLEAEVTEISTCGQDAHAQTKLFILYYYYGGLIYLTLKEYNKALFFFQVVMTTPAMVVSHIMKETYAKYITVSLIVHSKVIPLPHYVSPIVSRALKPLNTPYTDLASAFITNDSDRLRAVINKHQQMYQRHNNLGLVKQVSHALTRNNIQRLTKTFITLSLADMASRVKLADANEAEMYILEMIEDGTIHASIDSNAGMVSFHNDPEGFSSPEMLKVIDEQVRKCVALNESLETMDRDISVDSTYVQKVINMSHLDDAGKGDELIALD